MVAITRARVGSLAVGVEIVGGGLVTAALIWWGLVYFQVFLNTGFSLPSAAPCLLHTSDTCSLAMSLCSGKHLFGLTRYSEGLLWSGMVVCGLALTLHTLARRR